MLAKEKKEIRKIQYIVFFIILIGIIFVGYRFYLYKHYDVKTYSGIKDKFENVQIKKNFKLNAESDYKSSADNQKLTSNNVSFYVSKNVVKKTAETANSETVTVPNTFIVNDFDGKEIAYISICDGINWYNLFDMKDVTIYNYSVSKSDSADFLKDNNIENAYDAYKYMIDNYGKKLTPLSSKKTMQNIYLVNKMCNLAVNESGKLTLFEGDINGSITNIDDKIFDVWIDNGNDIYSIMFVNSDEESHYFTEESVNQIIQNLEFN